MKRRSIRFRLTVWYSLALTAGLIVFAAAIWLFMRHSLITELDGTLQAQTHALNEFLGEELNDPRTISISEELREYAGALPRGTAAQVIDDQRRILLSSRPGFPFPAGAAGLSTVEWSGRDFRTLLITGSQGGRLFSIGIAAPLDTLESFSRRLGWLLIAFIPPVILVAVAGGNWLSRRALRPVDEVTLAARKVGIGNLSERLNVPPTGDELARMAETWNGMLARIEAAVQRLSRFTADASHELRTPLSVIRTTAEIAARRDRSPDEYRASLGQIVAESQRMTQLVEDLLFLARCDAESAEMPIDRVDLAAVAEEACWHARSLSEANGVSIECHRSGISVPVEGNRVALRQLLMLLLDNAIKYSPAGGAVQVNVRAAERKVMLEIEDRGVGIPESALPHIFERFYRARQNGAEEVAGYGLGLSLAAAIAQRHGAAIEVKSSVERGSLFRVWFRSSEK